MSDLPPLQRVTCSGCRKPLGLTRSPSGRIFCTPECAEQPAVSANEARDDVIALLADMGRPKGTIAKEFGVSRQRVIQIAQGRGVAAPS